MAQDKEALRALMRQYIRPVYARALEKTGTQENAMAVTKRTMSLLARAAETGMVIDETLVLRMADDFCADMGKAPAERIEPAPQPEQAAAQARPQPPFTADRPRPKSANADRPQASPPKERYQVRPVPDLFDEDEEEFVEEKEEKRAGVGTVLVIMFLSLLIVAQIVALCVILISRGIFHIQEVTFLNNFADWFNAHIFNFNA